MLNSIVLISAIFLMVVAPIMTIARYYKPRQLSLWNNLWLIVLTILSWPFVLVVVATRKRDSLLLSIFWVSMLVFLVSFAYWIVLNVEQVIQWQEQFVM